MSQQANGVETHRDNTKLWVVVSFNLFHQTIKKEDASKNQYITYKKIFFLENFTVHAKLSLSAISLYPARPTQ